MKTWNTVLVGCGGISTTWLEVLKILPSVRVIGLVDLNQQNALTRQRDFGLEGVEISQNLDELLKKVKAEVVFDCTVPPAHREVVLSALKNGCHVMGEKPLADTMEHAREMVQAAKNSGLQYGVMQNRRWLPGIRRVRSALDQNLIGNVHSLHSDFFMGCHFGGFREEMKHVLLMDMAIHTFDQARFLMGKRCLSVIASEWNPPGSWYRHGASALAQFEVEEGGVYSYRGSWCAEGLKTSWESSWRIIGEYGTMLWDGGDGIQVEVADGMDKDGLFHSVQSLEAPFPKEEMKYTLHAGGIRNFINCLNSGQEPETPAHDNLHSLAMVHGALASAESGCRIQLSNI